MAALTLRKGGVDEREQASTYPLICEQLPRRYSVDIGYFSCIAFDGEALKTVRSLYAELPGDTSSPAQLPGTYVIELEGKRYAVGQGASTCRNPKAFANEDKTASHILKLAIAALIDDPRIELVVSHYDADVFRSALCSALGNGFEFIKNGTRRRLSIADIRVVDEGKGSWAIARQQHLLGRRGYSCIIDLGCDTFIASFYDGNGTRIRHQPYPQQGVKALALAIAEDGRLKAAVAAACNRQKPNVAIILDGFANGHYYAATPICWDPYFSEYLEAWFKGVSDAIQNDFADLLPTNTKFLVTGGGAYLVERLVAKSPAFQVLPKPEIANALGAFYL